ncbi:MAG TPA: hypothetical protein VEX36_11385 [Thermoleophilaceae bacterium]|nr:hypothetical protein [Thermoleophilaceae bacterium]
MVRRAVAFGAGLLVLLLFVFLVKGCLDSRKESAINDYVADVDGLMRQSNQQSDALFTLLAGGGDASDVEIENGLNGYRIRSAQLVDLARDLDHPDDLDTAQRYLVDTLDLRREGVGLIADHLPAAIAGGDQEEGGADEIAQDMQPFLASDQLYFRRVLPAIDQVLDQEGLEQKVITSAFLPDVSWLQPTEVATRIGGIGGAEGSADAAPGLHGNGLGAVTLGGVALTPGASTSVPLSDDLTIQVQVANQGENTETDVPVKVTIGSGADAISAEAVLDTIAAGETKTVDVPIDEQPPTGQNIPISVEIEAVPGEEKTDNNVGDFSAIFTS